MTENIDLQAQLVHFKTDDPYEIRHALRGARQTVNKINLYISEIEVLNAGEIKRVVGENAREIKRVVAELASKSTGDEAEKDSE